MGGGEEEDSHTPSHADLQYQKCNLCVCVEKGLQLYKRPCPYPKINLNGSNCLDSQFKPYSCRRKEPPHPTFLFRLPLLLLSPFFLVKISEMWTPPPLTIFPGSAPDIYSFKCFLPGFVSGRRYVSCFQCNIYNQGNSDVCGLSNLKKYNCTGCLKTFTRTYLHERYLSYQCRYNKDVHGFSFLFFFFFFFLVVF